MKMTLNLDELSKSTKTFEPLPEGYYQAQIESVEPRTFRSGNDGLAVTYFITDGEYRGRKVYDNIVFVPKAEFKVAQLYKALYGDDVDGSVTIDTEELEEAEHTPVRIRVGIREYVAADGTPKTTNAVKGVYFAGGLAKRQKKVNPIDAVLDDFAIDQTQAPF